jgi:hypothetical protein
MGGIVKRTTRAARAAFNTTLQTIVEFVRIDLTETERSDIARRLLLQVLNPGVAQHFGIVAIPKLMSNAPVGQAVELFDMLEGPIETLQANVRGLLANIVGLRELPPGVSGSGYQVGPFPLTLGVLASGTGSVPARHRLSLHGSVRDVFLAAVCQVLVQSPTQTVLQCPGCPNLFYKVGRQTHCSKACYDRYYWQSGYPAGKKRKARKKWYASKGWTLGARAKKKSRPSAHGVPPGASRGRVDRPQAPAIKSRQGPRQPARGPVAHDQTAVGNTLRRRRKASDTSKIRQ